MGNFVKHERQLFRPRIWTSWRNIGAVDLAVGIFFTVSRQKTSASVLILWYIKFAFAFLMHEEVRRRLIVLKCDKEIITWYLHRNLTLNTFYPNEFFSYYDFAPPRKIYGVVVINNVVVDT